ncbi:hypothetical protein OIE52_50910 [Streptomyces canus]|uniref:hypothetical protein n=1 Tax=Streptomyces canus TaxID=58343 RepID=UPI0030E3A43B
MGAFRDELPEEEWLLRAVSCSVLSSVDSVSSVAVETGSDSYRLASARAAQTQNATVS